MVKRFLKRLIGKLLIKLKFIYEENKLDIIYHNPNITIEADLLIEEYFSANLPSGDFSIVFGSHVRIKKYCHVLLFPKAKLAINSNVFLNNYCSFNCLESITIGENTMFGEGVKLYDHNHLVNNENNKLTVIKDQFNKAPIVIGKNCWIGSNVTILKGVTIGDNVVIGANNLIYQSIAANTVVKSKAAYIIDYKV